MFGLRGNIDVVKRKSFQLIGSVLTASNSERMLLILHNFIPLIWYKGRFTLFFLHTVFGDTTASTFIEGVLLFTEKIVWKDTTCLIF